MAKRKNTAKKKDEIKVPTTTLEVVESKNCKGAKKETQAQAGTKSTETPAAPRDTVAKESEKGKAKETKLQKMSRVEATVIAFSQLDGKGEIDKKALAEAANKVYTKAGGKDNPKEANWAASYLLSFTDAMKKHGVTLG